MSAADQTRRERVSAADQPLLETRTQYAHTLSAEQRAALDAACHHLHAELVRVLGTDAFELRLSLLRQEVPDA